jgi:XTP/dITP diphosphohydrolase
MKELIFATNNLHKLRELQEIVSNFHIVSLQDIGYIDDIPEEQDTIEGNALQKARTIFEFTGKDCFADDTGLEIEALNGAPGVYSARFAGENATYQENVILALHKMQGQKNRKAVFKTVIALILDKKEYLFEGRIDGEILVTPRGNNGFGYDPIFLPSGYDLSFAEMSAELKNSISHRGLATQKLVAYLRNNA